MSLCSLIHTSTDTIAYDITDGAATRRLFIRLDFRVEGFPFITITYKQKICSVCTISVIQEIPLNHLAMKLSQRDCLIGDSILDSTRYF